MRPCRAPNLQNLRALLLLILALPGLILAPGSAFVICLCGAGAVEPAPAGCCHASTDEASAPDCDGPGTGFGHCGNPGDCDGCLEIDLDEVLLATVDGPELVIAPSLLVAVALGPCQPVTISVPQGGSFIRPPPPHEPPNAGLLPGVLPLRI